MFLKARRLLRIAVPLALMTLSSALGCAEDLGPADYSSHEGLRPEVFNPPPVPPDPFQPGDERLSLGYFYEGGWSEEIPINLVTTNYFVFAYDVDDPVTTATFAEGPSDDRLEGLLSYEITLIDPPPGCPPPCFWAGGLVWDEPIDLSDWTTMYVGFKSGDPSFARFDITLLSGTEDSEFGAVLDPTDYGYTNDGQWHFLRIPLQDAIDAGWKPEQTRSPFIFGAPNGTPGDVMLIDNLYFTKE